MDCLAQLCEPLVTIIPCRCQASNDPKRKKTCFTESQLTPVERRWPWRKSPYRKSTVCSRHAGSMPYLSQVYFRRKGQQENCGQDISIPKSSLFGIPSRKKNHIYTGIYKAVPTFRHIWQSIIKTIWGHLILRQPMLRAIFRSILKDFWGRFSPV